MVIPILFVLFIFTAKGWHFTDRVYMNSGGNTGITKIFDLVEITLKDIYIEAEEEDIITLYSESSSSDETISASLRWGDNPFEREDIQLGFRGNSTKLLPKKPLSVTFDKSQDILYGSDRLNLNAMYTDPTMMQERLSMDLFRELGQPAPRTQYFNLYINGVYEGLYLHVERVDKNFLREAGLNPKATLIRDEFRHNMDNEHIDSFSVFGTDLSGLEDPTEVLMNASSYRGEPNWDAYAEFVQWVYDTPAGPEFHKGFMKRVDVDNFIDWLAVHYLVRDVDSYADDYWLYLDHVDSKAKWKFIPWDKDLTFGSGWREDVGVANHYLAYENSITSRDVLGNELIVKFKDTPELMNRLYQRIDELMGEVFPLSYFINKIKHISEVIEDWVEITPDKDNFVIHPYNHHGNVGDFSYYLERLLDFIELRYAFLEREINTIEGNTYEAFADLSEVVDTALLVDSNGFVIAKWTPNHLPIIGILKIQVMEKDGINGINRMWIIDYDGEETTGELTLFYRNDLGKDRNWYKDLTPVGSQWSLKMVEVINDDYRQLKTRVNPYSNKATATVTLKGNHTFLLIE